MYFFLNRFQKLKGEKATYCKSIYEKLNDKNKARLVKRGNVTATVMGTIYAVLLALAIASAVVSFCCKFWWAGVFFCTFGVLASYLTYSGFSWRNREGYEYAKLFGEEVIYMLGQQERDKMQTDVTVDTVLKKVATEQKVASKAKASKKKTEDTFVEMPIDTESIEIQAVEEKADKPAPKATKPAKKTAKVSKPAKSNKSASATAKSAKSSTSKSAKTTTSTKAKATNSATAKSSAKKSLKKSK